MGRPSKPKREHKTSLHISITQGLLRRIDELRSHSGRTRTDFITSIIEMAMFSQQAYANYMMRQKKLEVAYWEWEFNKAQHQAEIIKEEAREDQLKL